MLFLHTHSRLLGHVATSTSYPWSSIISLHHCFANFTEVQCTNAIRQEMPLLSGAFLNRCHYHGMWYNYIDVYAQVWSIEWTSSLAAASGDLFMWWKPKTFVVHILWQKITSWDRECSATCSITASTGLYNLPLTTTCKIHSIENHAKDQTR